MGRSHYNRRCCVTFCENISIPNRCGHNICHDCRFKMLKVSIEKDATNFKYKCPLCRLTYCINPFVIKHLMFNDKTKDMHDFCDDCTIYKITLQPCKKGCYCDNSRFEVELKYDE